MVMQSTWTFRSSRVICYIFLAAFWGLLLSGTLLPPTAHATETKFKIAIMQAQKGAAKKYRSLDKYLRTQGIQIQFVGASSYTNAAKMFASGEVDGMFSGSGVAGSMLIKDIAEPVLRPEDTQGVSTYWAVVVAPLGSEKFTGDASYFQDKKVIYCSLASSGEIFFRSLPGFDKVPVTVIKAPSHGAALLGLSKGVADVAIVKNRVWDSLKENYPKLKLVGQDQEENPNGTLIVSKKADTKRIKQLAAALYALEKSQSPEAKQVRADLGVRRFLPTERSDFEHTFELLLRAGVREDFEFAFK